METQTAQQIIDEVEEVKPINPFLPRWHRDSPIYKDLVDNGLFTIPQNELTKISWNELKKVSQ